MSQQSMFTTTEHQGVKPKEAEPDDGVTAKDVQRMSREEIEESLTDQQAQVLAQLRINGPLTDQQVADRLKIPRSSVNARRDELMDKGYVVPADTVEGKYGRPNKRWKVVPGLFD